MVSDQTSQRVWDLPTRLFHWALVVLIAMQFATAEFGFLSMQWHYRFGWATLALIVFRIVWGFVGSATSRFGQFVRGPSAIWRYLRSEWLWFGQRPHPGNAPHALGHNPLGGWSVVIMLLCVLLQAITGLFTSDDIDADGPFVDFVSNASVKFATRLHHLGETALLVLIGLHLSAIVLHRLFKHDELIVPMITGRKRTGVPAPRMASTWLAVSLFVLIGLAVGLLSLLGA